VTRVIERTSFAAKALCAILFIVGLPHTAQSQLSGSVSIGGQATNNVQSLDTTAPDQILMPAFELNYDVHPSGASTVTLTASYAPNFYALNPGLSFNETSIGATGMFYLTNQDAISAEALQRSLEGDVKSSHSSHLLGMGHDDLELRMFEHPADPIPTVPLALDAQTKNDSLVDLAVTALYTLSGELDSTDISPQGISKARVSELEDLRDSISEVISTIADLLDSTGYSESGAEVEIAELQGVRAPLLGLMPQTKLWHTDPTLLDSAIHFLQQAKPEQDFLPTATTPSAPPSATPETKQLVHTLASIPIPVQGSEVEGASAPNITLLASSTKLRSFGYNDVSIHEDVDDSGATTMATSLTIPVAYTNHAGVHYSSSDTLLYGGNYGGNPNDNRMLTFGGAVEGLTSTNFSLRGSYDYTHTDFPFDSVYSNTENRFTATTRTAIGKTTIFIGEGALGFKQYLTPLSDSLLVKNDTIGFDTTRGPKGKIISIKPILKPVKKMVTAQSNFNQFSYGIGIAELLGERWILGALADFNYNPTLRGYVTSAEPGTKKVRSTAQIADDEYTYNLGRYSIFSNARIFADFDFAFDLSYENRVYGGVHGPKGAVLYGDSSRTETGWFLNASLSKLIPFDNHLIGVFNALLLEAKLEWDNVVSSAEPSLYNYTLTDVTFTTTLTF